MRWLAWFHRWTGVGLCLLFLLWFVSGAVLVFVPFPSLSDAARLSGSERIELASVKVSPSQAFASAGGGKELRLISAAGRPAYVVKLDSGVLKPIDATTGAPAAPIGGREARRIAQAFAEKPAEAISAPFDYDQWVVHDHFDAWRPFFKVSIADGVGTQLYVSSRTGEVMQRTQAAERAWNWAGAVTHWIYFTAIRKSFTVWDQSVWWISLLGLTTAAVGVFLGAYRTLKRMKGRRPNWSPFRGWMRWHHGVGLGAAVFVLTWIFSGWLSMDHGRLFSRGVPPAQAEARYHGALLPAGLAHVGPGELAGLGPASQISFGVVGGRPFASAEGGLATPRVRLLDRAGAAMGATLPRDLIVGAIARAWPVAPSPPGSAPWTDPMYRAAEGMSDRVLRFPLASPRDAALYIDPVTGRLVVLMDASRKAYVWTYYALHTLNFPGLIDHPTLKRTIELVLMGIGVFFSVTGLILAIKRLRISAPTAKSQT